MSGARPEVSRPVSGSLPSAWTSTPVLFSGSGASNGRRTPSPETAARLPFPDRTFDLTLTVMIFHHLDDATVTGVLPELARVTSGHLLFLEPLLNDRRPISRWLWRYDRGRYPRARTELVERLERAFDLVEVDEFSVYHEYLLCVGKPRREPGRF